MLHFTHKYFHNWLTDWLTSKERKTFLCFDTDTYIIFIHNKTCILNHKCRNFEFFDSSSLPLLQFCSKIYKNKFEVHWRIGSKVMINWVKKGSGKLWCFLPVMKGLGGEKTSWRSKVLWNIEHKEWKGGFHYCFWVGSDFSPLRNSFFFLLRYLKWVYVIL